LHAGSNDGPFLHSFRSGVGKRQKSLQTGAFFRFIYCYEEEKIKEVELRILGNKIEVIRVDNCPVLYMPSERPDFPVRLKCDMR